jgi:outer membrane protein
MFFGSISCFADVAAVKFGIAGWDHEPTGSIRYQGTDTDLASDLNLSKDAEGFAWIAIEHPVPGLPNFKIRHTKLSSSGSGVLNSSFTFGGTTFNVAENVNSQVKLNHTDLILYWELADNKVDFDIGINVKFVDAEARIERPATSTVEQVDFKGAVPMLYADLQLNITKRVSLGFEGSFLAVGDHKVADYSARLKYQSIARVGFEIGYRRIDLEFDNLDGVDSDIGYKGPYAAISFHF